MVNADTGGEAIGEIVKRETRRKLCMRVRNIDKTALKRAATESLNYRSFSEQLRTREVRA
jgi:hypothetical protein